MSSCDLKQPRKMHRDAQVLTCVYCGHAYPPGTPASGSDALTAHIKTREKHPLREAEARCEKLEKALRDLVESEESIDEWNGTENTSVVKAGRALLADPQDSTAAEPQTINAPEEAHLTKENP